MRAGAIAEIAGLEFRIQVRGRWMLGFGLLFAALVTGVSYYGLTFLGYEAKFQDFYRTTVTMLNLVLIIVPVVALVAGGQSLCRDAGYMEFLASQPVSRTDILLGKILGLFAALTVMTVLGFGLGGLVIAVKSQSVGIWKYLIFVGVSLTLGLVFLVLAALLSIMAHRRPMAIVTGLILWLFFLFIYDLIVLSAAYYVNEAYLRTMLYFSLLGNPIDIARSGGSHVRGWRGCPGRCRGGTAAHVRRTGDRRDFGCWSLRHLDRDATDHGGAPVQTTGYGMINAGVHKRPDKLRVRVTWLVVACALLASCMSRQAPEPGDRALEFDTRSLSGGTLRFTPDSGSIHLLYFWADWCPRCEDDFHLMEKLFQQWSKQADAPRFLAVDVGQSDEHVQKLRQEDENLLSHLPGPRWQDCQELWN